MNVPTGMHKLIGASEDDDDEDIDMDAKNEEDDMGGKDMAASMMVNMDDGIATSSSNDQFQYHSHIQEQPNNQGGGAKRPRPLEEKERTKLRERHRRAITARILAGLRRHGNYNLRVRADINDVIAALAREAGWVVLPDGTTFPSQSQDSRPSGDLSVPATLPSSQVLPLQTQSASFKGAGPGFQNSVDYNACQMKSVFVASASPYDVSSSSHSHVSSTLGSRGERTDTHLITSSSVDTIDNRQVVDPLSRIHEAEHDFAGTSYIPVYVTLPLGIINMKCELTDPDGLRKQLRILKSINVDGVMVDCWWGIVEAHAPQEYNWNGYKKLFQIVRDLKLKLQVVISFHECGGNFRDDVCIPLPLWVAEIGRNNPDIYFTDREGRRNPECLSWGIDKERVLKGRTALEVYFDFMRSFRIEFHELFEDGIISMIVIGLGPCGDLRYPSFPVKHGWRYPGLGEFQCYDQYMLKSLRKAAEARGQSVWAKGPTNAGFYNSQPTNAGFYNSQPHETGFFCDGGEYNGYYGRFFLNWYSQVLVDHGDRILSLAKLAFDGTCIAVKLSGIHWWYKSASHAAELTAGFYNPSNRDGYAAVMSMLKKHGAALNFTTAEVGMLDQLEDSSHALADPEGLAWQVLNAAWDVCIPVASENSVPCHSRDLYNKVLENAKPFNDPDGRHLLSFTYHRLSLQLMERHNLLEFERFVKRMHGEAVLDTQT